MTDLQAAVGLVQLGRLDEVVARRRELAARYAKAVAEHRRACALVADPAWGTATSSPSGSRSCPSFPLDRDELLAHLAEADISARRGIMAAHRQPAYAGRDPARRCRSPSG